MNTNTMKMSELLGNEDNQKVLRSYLQAEGERLYLNVLQGLETQYASLSVLIAQKRKGADPLARLRRIKETFAVQEPAKEYGKESSKESAKKKGGKDQFAGLGDSLFDDAAGFIDELFGLGQKRKVGQAPKQSTGSRTDSSKTNSKTNQRSPLENVCDTYLVFVPTKQEVEAKTILAIKSVAVSYDQNPLRVAPSNVYAGEILKIVFPTFIEADLYLSGRLKLEEELYAQLRKVDLTAIKGTAEKDAIALFQALPLASHLKIMHDAMTVYKKKEFERIYVAK